MVDRTVKAAFATFDEALNLDQAERRQAKFRHEQISEVLTAADVATGTFVQGSFARKTMLKPLKDIDIVVMLDPEARGDLEAPYGPTNAMQSFKEPIRRQWPDVGFDQGDKPAGKALRLSFADCGFTVDLVAALPHGGDYVLVGDRHEGTWTPSNTRIQIRRVRERNVIAGGRFVHQVRELRSWCKHQDGLDFVTGIVIESLAYSTITGRMTDQSAVAAVLNHAATAVLGPVVEPAGDDDVTIKWTEAQRQTAALVFAEQARRANEALHLEEAGDELAAIDGWHAILGEDFPAAPARSTEQVLAAWAAGSLTAQGRPTTTRAARQPTPPGRAWSSR